MPTTDRFDFVLWILDFLQIQFLQIADSPDSVEYLPSERVTTGDAFTHPTILLWWTHDVCDIWKLLNQNKIEIISKRSSCGSTPVNFWYTGTMIISIMKLYAYTSLPSENNEVKNLKEKLLKISRYVNQPEIFTNHPLRNHNPEQAEHSRLVSRSKIIVIDTIDYWIIFLSENWW